MNIFTRSKLNPILKPDKNNSWEALKLYNPGAIFHDNKYHLFYRAVGAGSDWNSAIGYAVSDDGENFQRFAESVLIGEGEAEKRGLEDPRITKIGDTFYMTYAAYDGKTPRLLVATSKDLKTWQKQGAVFADWNFAHAGGVYTYFVDGKPQTKEMSKEWSKSGAIFPEKINGKFLMLFGEHRIWFAESDDGLHWTGDEEPFLEPRTGDYFDNTFVEMGPPPIKTERGWLVLYHGINNAHRYRIGVLLLDLNNPRRILYRSIEAIFEPQELYELAGLVDVLPGGLDALQKLSESEQETYIDEALKKGTMPKVTFCCGAVVVGDALRIYYGAGDSVICTATAKMSDVMNFANQR
ncbi:hypothetical protein L6270_02265 [Candidatus Parcubacteria bacterium]|nr:hypothetical protein [Patescibacteria group bacterium]MBU4309481.1 hypothetical protein [Patescibacteria group bacterium]MBU4432614.1 hypothetical protein [Patescibacteria group bacterium]MBU4577187.1 hypothetical protein [Patescibacteria group bacterium]MCG2696835.1 hypothetical protein [Candidatus Parcubacteria bacterium]